MKQVARALLVTLLVLAMITPALAMPAGMQAPKGRPFADVTGTWAEWAITKMYGLGIVKGVGDGQFDPEGQLTRAQIATMFARALGLEEKAQGLGPLMARAFGDEAEIPEWAAQHVRVCFQMRLLLGEIRGNVRFFNPMKPITRQEFVVLLVRAAGVEEEAAELVDSDQERQAVLADLNDQFRDAKTIGLWALGSIAYAMEEGWIDCLLGGPTFQPNKPVTRAEACSMLEAAELELQIGWTNRYIGVIAELDLANDEITINPGARVFTLAEGCLARIDGEAAELEDLAVGMAVKLYANSTGVVCIEARTAVEDDDEDDEDEELELIGYITDVNLGGLKITFELDEPDAEATEYEVDVAVVIKDGDDELPFDGDLEDALEGVLVEIKLINNVVVRITVED